MSRVLSRASGEGPAFYCEVGGLPVEVVASEFTGAGVFVQTTSLPEVDEEIELFMSTGRDRLTVRGLVVQVVDFERAAQEQRAPGFGVLFTHVSDPQREWLDKTSQEVRERAARALAEARREERRRARESERQQRATEAAHRPAPGAAAPQRPRPAPGEVRHGTPPSGSRVARARVGQSHKATSEAEQALSRLRRELEQVQRAPPWKVLGISSDADAETAKAAFLARSKKIHPHAYARFQSDELTATATQLFIVHKKALASIERKASTTAKGGSRKDGPIEPASVPPEKMKSSPPRKRGGRSSRSQSTDAEMAVTDGLKMLAAGNYGEARRCFEFAVDLNPTSRNAKIWLLLCDARKLKQEGKRERANEAFLAVLELDPKHREALDETKTLPASKRKKGNLLDRFFGSGD